MTGFHSPRTLILVGMFLITIGVLLSLYIASPFVAILSTCLGLFGGAVLGYGISRWDLRSHKEW